MLQPYSKHWILLYIIALLVKNTKFKIDNGNVYIACRGTQDLILENNFQFIHFVGFFIFYFSRFRVSALSARMCTFVLPYKNRGVGLINVLKYVLLFIVSFTLFLTIHFPSTHNSEKFHVSYRFLSLTIWTLPELDCFLIW